MEKAAEQTLKHIVQATREVLLRAVDEDTQSGAYVDSPLRSKFQGCCGLAQCVAGYALQDLAIAVNPVATQSLDMYWHSHAALTVEFLNVDEKRWFVVDPTFCQFCVQPKGDEPPTPENHLLQSSEGRSIREALLSDGYFELTIATAAAYVSAFCGGTSCLTDEQALDFLCSPPPHPYHFRREIDCDAFSRENLARRNWFIPHPKLI